ncbi:DUF2835 domain-containing protein [Motiliproteus sp. SC1-56]|uniref:DUF2835 domain-containing protein n=1 Tax=Motiliproteus sp. SC1-56 TaxID=2799565 RepID=UPI001F5DCFE9|nr:DUF2835 domain-containing protein [Motiliproteus sp. SC1-56]
MAVLPMQEIYLNLTITADEYLKLYKGAARNVFARSVDGKRVRFPANILQPFVTREGIRGRFAIRFDDGGRFHDIRRV